MHIGKKDKDDKPDGRKALEEQVDAMMDPKRPDGASDKVSEAPEDAPPKVSAVSTAADPAKTAPQLSDDLKKKAGISDTDTKPLSMDKLDEIAGKISEDDKKATKDDKADDEPEQPDSPEKDLDEGTADLDDARTEEAVEDIVSHEGDVMLAVEDATRKKHNPELATPKTGRKGGHRILATIMWTLVAFVAIVAVLFLVLLTTGRSVSAG